MFKYFLRHKDFLNFYKGQKIVIVGSGPTKFAYEDLNKINGPIVFINDSHVLEKYATNNKHTHFITYHSDFYYNSFHSIKSKIWSQRPHVNSKCIAFKTELYFSLMKKHTSPDCLLDKEWIIKNEFLGMCALSPSLGIHLAYLSGCSSIHLIGCHNHNDPTHDPRINNKIFNAHSKIRLLESWADFLGFEFSELTNIEDLK